MLLGRDVGNLLELAIKEEEAFAVLTRLQTQRKERDEVICLARELAHGAKHKNFQEIQPTPVTENKDTSINDLSMLHDELFHGKKSENSEPREKDDPQEKDPKPKNQPEVSEEEESRPYSEWDMTADQLRDLQSNDKTLDKIRQYIRDKTSENEKNTSCFIVKDGIIYRQWSSRKQPSTCATVEQLVLYR